MTTVSASPTRATIPASYRSAWMKVGKTPSLSAFLRATAIASASMSTPVTRDAPRSAAPTARIPVPHPRSQTRLPSMSLLTHAW